MTCQNLACATAPAPLGDNPVRQSPRRAKQRAEQTVGGDLGDHYGADFPDQFRRCHDLDRLKIWGAADDLASVTPGLLEQDFERASEETVVERRLMAVDEPLEAVKPLRLFLLRYLIVPVGCRRS